jgi:hypothetical protein
MTPKQTNNYLARTLGQLTHELQQIRGGRWPMDEGTSRLARHIVTAANLLKTATELNHFLSPEIEEIHQEGPAK